MPSAPVLHLVVGLPAVGKTTLARQIEAETGALRLTPDEWLLSLFGASATAVERDVLEGRLLWVASRVLRGGLSVVVDFGCWSPEERSAIRDLADRAGASFQMHYLSLAEPVRRERAAERSRRAPGSTYELSDNDHDRFAAAFVAPSELELASATRPAPPPGFATWSDWASWRWPSLPASC